MSTSMQVVTFKTVDGQSLTKTFRGKSTAEIFDDINRIAGSTGLYKLDGRKLLNLANVVTIEVGTYH